MTQLVLPTPGVLAHRLDQALEKLHIEEARELLLGLRTLRPDHAGYRTALEAVTLLHDALGRRFPPQARHVDKTADAWEAVRAQVAEAELSWEVDPLDRLHRSWCRHFGDQLERLGPGTVFRGVPAGWYHLEAGRIDVAVSSLEATVQTQPTAPHFALLAAARYRQGPSPAARAAALAALLAGPATLDPAALLDPEVVGLEGGARDLALPGDPRLWMAALGLCDGVFTWDMLPGEPVWGESGMPLGVTGQPGAVLTFLRMLARHRASNAAPNWQTAEARRQLKQLAPALLERYLASLL